MRVERFYDYEPSGLAGEAIAYLRGTDPDPQYRMLKGEIFNNWIAPHFDIGGVDEATGERTDTGILTDFLHCDLIWLIVHKRVKGFLTRLNVRPDRIQWLDVCLHHEGKELVGEYFVANILDVRSKAVNEQRSKYAYSAIGRTLAVVVLRKEAVAGADIFRINEWATRVYFSARLKDFLTRAKVTGVAWGSSPVDG